MPQRVFVVSPFASMALSRCSGGTPSPPLKALAAAAPAAAVAAALKPVSLPAGMPNPSHGLARHLKLLLQLNELAAASTSPTTPPSATADTAAAAAAAQARSTDVLAYLAGWGRLAEQQGGAEPPPSCDIWSSLMPSVRTGDMLGERQQATLHTPRASPASNGRVQKHSKRRFAGPRQLPTP
ncbi:hypothetical protein C2E21_8640 [Chlorella sorokiniana]|jgi:hypothetical protein|uniref:Uncharacterized protein n=1 Tax=Chlorella sorokiniana TaxID=3076 RepID=A0A2P6TE54_CHLSO|nr:hypothetical protein C2E21_8640 [Chlorella sorokiniana]|eukprot:PRW20921.1 hypothetical protein C2E21_8640 [Chlorella sorokiniana]